MDINSVYIARRMFKLKIHESDGSAFETLFTRVMGLSNKNFQQVKPQGTYGDRKNDGFDKTTGTYYQVYAPEDIRKSESEAIKKVARDLEELINQWNSICPIKQFYFVINDKYRNLITEIHTVLIELENKYSIKCNTFSSKNLEDIFINLDEIDIIDIVGHVNIPNLIDELNYDVLNEVVNYLMNYDFKEDSIEKIVPPDFEKKILFNGLSKKVEGLLNSGYAQTNALEHYFSNNSEFLRNEIKTKLHGLYLEANDKFNQASAETSDDKFFYIWEKACPSNKLAIRNTVLVLMGYYFEACDIFEPPK